MPLLPTRKRVDQRTTRRHKLLAHVQTAHKTVFLNTTHTLEGALRACVRAKLRGAGPRGCGDCDMARVRDAIRRPLLQRAATEIRAPVYGDCTQPSAQPAASRPPSPPLLSRWQDAPNSLISSLSQRRRAAGPDRGPQLVFPPWWFRDQRITIVRLSAALHVARRAERAPCVADGRRRVPGSLAAEGAERHPLTRQPWPP
jgi:hypothetical protein